MEKLMIQNQRTSISEGRFLEANTLEMNLKEIRDRHIIPVFLKDNEPAISQVEFVEAVSEAAREVYNLPFAPDAIIRVSHPIKGRVFEARHKKANELLPMEKTIYYERMAFMVSLKDVIQDIDGQLLELTIGGVKAYNLDNMNASKGSNENFKLFIGFKNTVCTNLCISTDGIKLDLKVRSLQQLYEKAFELFAGYDALSHKQEMQDFTRYALSENQFAQIIGKSRLYQHLPKEEKLEIPELLITDTQISKVADCYYYDNNFNRSKDGSIDLWRFYNLLTGAVKSSYIDKFLEKGVNAFEFTRIIKKALDDGKENLWYLK